MVRTIKKIIRISLILLVSLLTSPVYALSDGKNRIYIKGNVGIKNKQPLAALDLNGALLIRDGSEGRDKLLQTDISGRSSWAPITDYPSVVGNNNSYNHLLVNNGFLQDSFFNGTTTVSNTISYPGTATNYLFTIRSNGSSYWAPNYGANGTSNDPLWQESFNIIFPKTNNGDFNLTLGANGTAAANIVFTKNGGAQFNKSQ